MWPRKRWRNNRLRRPINRVSYTFARSTAPITIDGKIDEWPELLNDTATVIDVQESPQLRYGRVQARYDDQHLYLAYRVFGPNQPRNAGQDPLLYFKTGDCVDLMLGPSDGKLTGAVRLLFTVAGGKPMAVLYEKSVPGIAAKDRVPFSSPWRGIYFDRVTVNPADVQVMTGATAGGYVVEARVAWTRPRSEADRRIEAGKVTPASSSPITAAPSPSRASTGATRRQAWSMMCREKQTSPRISGVTLRWNNSQHDRPGNDCRAGLSSICPTNK